MLSSVRGGFATQNAIEQGRVVPVLSFLVISENVVVLKVPWTQEVHIQPPSPFPAPTHLHMYMCRKKKKEETYSQKQWGNHLLQVCTTTSLGLTELLQNEHWGDSALLCSVLELTECTTLALAHILQSYIWMRLFMIRRVFGAHNQTPLTCWILT